MVPCRIEVATKSSERLSASVDYPRGHIKNPMTAEEVESKFRALAGRVLSPDRVERALVALSALEAAANVDEILELLVLGDASGH